MQSQVTFKVMYDQYVVDIILLKATNTFNQGIFQCIKRCQAVTPVSTFYYNATLPDGLSLAARAVCNTVLIYSRSVFAQRLIRR